MELEAKNKSDVELVIEIDASEAMEIDDFEPAEIDVEEPMENDVGPELAMIDGEEFDMVFVDIQGFRDYRSRFICKEFCSVSGKDVYHALIKSPFRFAKLPGYFKNQANYNTRYIHGLTYDCGNVHLNDFLQTAYMKMLGKKVIVKGAQKVQWMKYLFRNCGEIDCVNMEDWGYCKSMHESRGKHEICDYHYNNYRRQWRCAKENALKLREIILEHRLYTWCF